MTMKKKMETTKPTPTQLDGLRKKLGKEIKRKIKAEDLSYYSISKATGISTGQIHRIEEGENCTLDSLILLVSHLEIPMKIGDLELA